MTSSSDNDTRPKVSVIVLTYNHEKYIRKALDSILMQVVDFDYEILIGDDASSDNTCRILKEYQIKYPNIIHLFLNRINLGATKNAYNVLMHAKGEYLATCEGDDYWSDPQKLQVQVQFLENNLHFIGCTHKFTMVDENDVPLKSQNLTWVRQKKIFSLSDFHGLFLPGQPSTFVRRNVFKKSIIDPKYLYKLHPLVGDRTAMFMFLIQGKFFLIERKMSAYRINKRASNSITTHIMQNKLKYWKLDYDLINAYERIALKKGIKVDFSMGKKIIFSKSFLYGVYTSEGGFLKLAKKIITEQKSWPSYVMFVPFYILNRLYSR